MEKMWFIIQVWYEYLTLLSFLVGLYIIQGYLRPETNFKKLSLFYFILFSRLLLSYFKGHGLLLKVTEKYFKAIVYKWQG